MNDTWNVLERQPVLLPHLVVLGEPPGGPGPELARRVELPYLRDAVGVKDLDWWDVLQGQGIHILGHVSADVQACWA